MARTDRYAYAPDSLKEEPASNALGCPFMAVLILALLVLLAALA